MKWLTKVYHLFVEDTFLAVAALVSLAISAGLAYAKFPDLAGLILFLFIAASIIISLRHS
jgi:hypothetical protein